MQWLAQVIWNLLVKWGYMALAACLLGESAGIPLPGETILIYSSFVARKSNHMNLALIMLVGSVCAVIGDNLGYFAGRYFGRRLLRGLSRKFDLQDDIAAAAKMIHFHGGATIFWARFVFGLRTVAGPVAGALNMQWKKFLLYNVLGAFSWIVAISLTGYLFAERFKSLAGYIEKISWVISGTVFLAGYLIWRYQKKQIKARLPDPPLALRNPPVRGPASRF